MYARRLPYPKTITNLILDQISDIKFIWIRVFVVGHTLINTIEFDLFFLKLLTIKYLQAINGVETEKLKNNYCE